METAGKQVDDDELRDLMKENGIGRPSTRANIIETLFKRKYIKRNKKQVLPTVTGIQLIETIQNELLKSAELTGSWEKQLKDIEKGAFSAAAFIKNMKRMVDALVCEVRSETKRANISQANVIKNRTAKATVKNQAGILAEICPKCKKGNLIKGKSAFGCSDYKSGCDFVLPFSFSGKKISEKQFIRLLQKGSTVNLKSFKTASGNAEGLLRFDENFKLKLEPKQTSAKKSKPDELLCPKCKKGKVIKGKTAYGCSAYKSGCDFKMTFDSVRMKMKGQQPTKALVYSILNGEH
jgi:DNA topoisomerase-3